MGDLCRFRSSGDLSNTTPRLEPLADNGGGTLTHALPADSPAVDSADPNACPATDQRRVARPDGAGCDRGAFERPAVQVSPTPSPTANPSPTATPVPPAGPNTRLILPVIPDSAPLD